MSNLRKYKRRMVSFWSSKERRWMDEARARKQQAEQAKVNEAIDKVRIKPSWQRHNA